MKFKIVFFGADRYSQIVLNSLKKDHRFQLTKETKRADVGVLASYGKILTGQELNQPKKGILNLHPSLLPKYRGASPVQTAILNGDRQTGITIIKMDEKIDHGPIVAQFSEEILPTDNAESLYFRLFSAGAEFLKTILPVYLQGQIELREQNHLQASYTKKLTREDGRIDWQKPAEYLERLIRAFYPWPGAFASVKLKNKIFRLKILKAHLENHKLVLDVVQLEGKKPVRWKQFCEGYPEAKII